MDGHHKKVLLVSPHFPPSGNPQALQGYRLARALAAGGLEVEVIAAGADRFEPSNSHAGGGLDPEGNIAVRRFRSAAPWARSWGLTRRAYRMFHPLDPYFHQSGLLETLDRRLREARFDVIISRSEPLASHHALLERRELAGAARQVYWFSDPVPTSRTPEMMKLAWRRRRCEGLLEGCLRSGDLVIAATEEILEAFQGRRGGAETWVLPHTFDPEEWPWPPARGSIAGGGIEILHTGSFYWTRHPFTFLEGVERWVAAGAQGPRVRLLGTMTEALRRDLNRRRFGFSLELERATDAAGANRAIERADLLCVIDCELARNVHLPSKVADYVGACKPILYVGRPDSPTCRLLARAHPAFRQAGTPDQVREALDWLVEHSRAVPPEAYRASYRLCLPDVVYAGLLERCRAGTARAAAPPVGQVGRL